MLTKFTVEVFLKAYAKLLNSALRATFTLDSLIELQINQVAITSILRGCLKSKKAHVTVSCH